MQSLSPSNEPLLVQALEEAILFRRWCADGNSEPYKSEDLIRIREYRKLLFRARGRTILRRRSGNSHPGEVR